MTIFDELREKLISSKLLYKCSNKLFNQIVDSKELQEHLLRFCNDNIIKYIDDISYRGNNKITLNSLKLSYKLYQNDKRLFIPIYYRSYSGHWQLCSGACSGSIFEYPKQGYTHKYDMYEYLIFEHLSDLIKPNTKVFSEKGCIISQKL